MKFLVFGRKLVTWLYVDLAHGGVTKNSKPERKEIGEMAHISRTSQL